MLAALLLGGASSAPLHNIVIQLLAIVLLALLAWRGALMPRGTKEVIVFALLAVILVTPLLQTIPLPYPLWSKLPGRDLVVQVNDLVGIGRTGRPLSLDPEATLLSGAFLIPPAVIFLAALKLSPGNQRRIASLVVLGALFSLALGGLQVAAGGQAFRLYSGSHSEFPTGLFINRNHQSTLFLISVLLTGGLLEEQGPSKRLAIWLVAVTLFAIGVIATASRFGFVMLPLAVLASADTLSFKRLKPGRAGLIFFGTLAALTAGLVSQSAGTERMFARFSALNDVRFGFWNDTLVAANQYFPLGSGLGTFDSVFRMYEDLNNVTPQFANHAHNDYLELLLETGAWGCILLGLFLVIFGRLGWRAVQPSKAPLPKAAAYSLLVLLLHSGGDYPLRMLSLLMIFGLLSAILVSASAQHQGRETD